MAAFLDGRIGFPPYPGPSEVMDDHPCRAVATLEDVLAADAWARERTQRRSSGAPLETV